MKINNKKIAVSFFVSACIVFLCSVRSFADMSGIETALIEQDFQRVKVLSEEIIRGNADKNIKNLAQYYIGVSHLRLKEYDKAQDVFKELVNNNLEADIKDKTYIGFFDSYYLQGNYDEALKIITKLIKTSPKSNYLSLIYLKAARVNLKLAQWEEAKNYLIKITVTFPKSFEYYSALQLLSEQHFFAVQVGSFIERSRAESLVEELNKKNQYAYILETLNRNNKKLYRVRVGKLSVLSEAQQLKTTLEGQGYPTEIFP